MTRSEGPSARHRIAVDVGGTFTDVFVFDEQSGAISVTKVPSTPSNPARAIIDGVKATGIPASDIRLFSHGTTVGTNALITRRLPRTALVTTEGFRDILEIRRGTKQDLWDAYKDNAPPYIPRRDRLEVAERVDYNGAVLTALDEAAARKVAQIIRRREIGAVAVCFINAYVNDAHERRMREILQEEIPGVLVTLSSDINPEIFEPERLSTTVINAVLQPVVGKYMHDLETELRDMGYQNEVLVLHSGGGVLTAKSAAQYAARLAVSGLAGGGVAMKYVAQLAGYDNAIGFDMGGTSTDISLMWQGQLRVTNEWAPEYGYPIRFPSIDVITIGAGGGSVAWIDEGGSLHNGPQSAGAEPGPACYRRGGTEATNTDANVVLGRLGSSLLQGGVGLDSEAAHHAVESHIAGPLGMSAVKAADAIIQVANANMANAVRLLSVQHGYDPRDFAFVAFGGAGPLHAVELAQDLHIPTVIIPPYPGITSAMGCLLVDIRHDFNKTVLYPAAPESTPHIEEEFGHLEAEARAHLEREGTAPENIELIRQLDMRYLGQWRTLTVTAAGQDMAGLLAAFHDEHGRTYSFSREDQSVEIYGLRVTAIGKIPKPELPRHPRRPGVKAEAVGERKVYFREHGLVSARIYDRAQLAAGAVVHGPAIVEQKDSTTVIPPEIHAEVDEYLNLIMKLGVQGHRASVRAEMVGR